MCACLNSLQTRALPTFEILIRKLNNCYYKSLVFWLTPLQTDVGNMSSQRG